MISALVVYGSFSCRRHHEVLSEMKLCNLVQVFMGGPNVNWSFLGQISSDLHNEYGTTIFCLGSCFLVHVISMLIWIPVAKHQIGRFRFNWNHFKNFLKIALHACCLHRFYRMQSVSKKVLFSKVGWKCWGLRKSAKSIQAHQAVHFQSKKNYLTHLHSRQWKKHVLII